MVRSASKVNTFLLLESLILSITIKFYGILELIDFLDLESGDIYLRSCGLKISIGRNGMSISEQRFEQTSKKVSAPR